MTKKEQMLQLRKEGLKYREIAELCGVSIQYVSTVCSISSPAYFKPVGEECIYPNLRDWMNKHKVSRMEFLRRMGLTLHASNYERLCGYITGKIYPRKPYIDKMLAVTGMTYETMFAVVKDTAAEN